MQAKIFEAPIWVTESTQFCVSRVIRFSAMTF